MSRGEGIPDPWFVARGDGPISIAIVDGKTIETGDACSKLWRVDARGRATRLSSVPSSLVFAVSANRFAVARASKGAFSVDIRDRRGRLIRVVHGKGSAQALALSASVVAVLVESSTGAMRLHVYAGATGRLRWSVPLPRFVWPSLSAAGSTIIYRNGKEIWAADVASQRRTYVATAATDPIDLSIEGRRVAWAENRNGRGRIRAIEIPR